MKNKNIIIGLIIGIAMTILWSIVFVNVLNSMAGIGIEICLGMSLVRFQRIQILYMHNKI